MLLAVDSSTAQVGLALYDGVRVPAELVWSGGAHHTQQLAPALAELLARSGVQMNQVSAVGVALGPGSFTSLRVGLAFVKGLALARHLPVIGVPTLDVVAAAVPLPEPVDGAVRPRLAAVVQAGRGRLAVGWYRPGENSWESEGPASVTNAEELTEKIRKRVIICGELTAEDRQRLARKFKNVHLASPAQCVRRPAYLAELAWQKLQAGQVEQTATLAPIYLHIAGGLPA